MRSRIVGLLFCFFCSYTVINTDQLNQDIFHYDMSGYYLYLPSVVIYKDLAKSDFYHEIAREYPIGGGSNYGINEMPNGRRLNKYAVGVSLFELPGFLIAHAFCKITKTYKPDGYSAPYKTALIFSTILWSMVGLFVLRKFLLRHFTDTVTAIVIACIAFGTNFYAYAAFEQGMSHNFSLVLFAGVLLYMDKWYAEQKRKDMVIMGLLVGLIAITRSVNLPLIIVPLLWGVYNKDSFLARLKLLVAKYKDILIAILCFLAVTSIQLAYWKYITGHWLYFSYVGEEFIFKDPQLINGLFSYRKGWFVYTPIAFIGLCGLFVTPRKYAISIITFFTVMIYVVFSWENWYYGGGFGARALIETLPVLAVPLAYLTKAIVTRRSIIIKSAYILILSFFIFLSIFQGYQYFRYILHYDRMTKAFYWRIFLKVKMDGEDYQYLMKDEEVYDEMEKWRQN